MRTSIQNKKLQPPAIFCRISAQPLASNLQKPLYLSFTKHHHEEIQLATKSQSVLCRALRTNAF